MKFIQDVAFSLSHMCEQAQCREKPVVTLTFENSSDKARFEAQLMMALAPSMRLFELAHNQPPGVREGLLMAGINFKFAVKGRTSYAPPETVPALLQRILRLQENQCS